MLNAISVDVEEYFHAANLEPAVGRRGWDRLDSRVVYATDRVLALFDRCGVKGTFFILGYCARRHPELVRRIAEAGHEIASHGYAHRIAYHQTPAQFHRDIRISKELLEDISGEEVLGYRAPNFSITNKNEWAYDALIEAGYLYDSSRYPIRHPRYTNIEKSREPELLTRDKGRIYIFPLATAKLEIFGSELRLPVAGGAYWRIFPKFLMAWGLRRIRDKEKSWGTCYFHPWELDPGQPRYDELSLISKLRHYTGVAEYENILEYFLKRFDFGTIKKAAEQSFGPDVFSPKIPSTQSSPQEGE